MYTAFTRILWIGFAVLSLTVFSGCAVLKSETGRVLLKSAVQYKFIDYISGETPEKRSDISELLDDVHTYFSLQKGTVEEIRAIVVERAVSKGKTPAQIILLKNMVDMVSAEVEQYAEDGKVPIDAVYRVDEVLDWFREYL